MEAVEELCNLPRYKPVVIDGNPEMEHGQGEWLQFKDVESLVRLIEERGL